MTESNWSLLNSILNVCFYWLCSFLNLILLVLAMLYLHKDRDLKSYHLIAFGKSNFQRKFHLPLNKWFPNYCNFYLLGVGYRVTIFEFVNFVYKWTRQLFSGFYKIMSDWFTSLEHFLIDGLNFIIVVLYYFLN